MRLIRSDVIRRTQHKTILTFLISTVFGIVFALCYVQYRGRAQQLFKSKWSTSPPQTEYYKQWLKQRGLTQITVGEEYSTEKRVIYNIFVYISIPLWNCKNSVVYTLIFISVSFCLVST